MNPILIGVGSGAGNFLTRLTTQNFGVCATLAINTDELDLRNTRADHKLQIGESVTADGFGTCRCPETGEESLRVDVERVIEAIVSHDVILVLACLGGGTGSGASPVLADIGRRMGKCVVTIGTFPFEFEGEQCQKKARIAYKALRPVSHASFPVFLDNCLENCPVDNLVEAYPFTDRVLETIVRKALQRVSCRDSLEGVKDHFTAMPRKDRRYLVQLSFYHVLKLDDGFA